MLLFSLANFCLRSGEVKKVAKSCFILFPTPYLSSLNLRVSEVVPIRLRERSWRTMVSGCGLGTSRSEPFRPAITDDNEFVY